MINRGFMKNKFKIESELKIPEHGNKGKINKGVSESNIKRIVRNKELEEARKNGETTYFSEKPCKKGHVGKKWVSTRGCVECSLQRVREHKLNNPENSKIINKRNWLKSAYNLTIEEFKLMIEKQNNKCAICCNILVKIHVDHCHKTGKIRGLLCPSCNKGIGHFNDSYAILINAANYCKKHE